MSKFLDASGVSFLWSQLSMQDYPSNETLVAVINAIDETKANKDNVLFKTQQELTTEELSQVHENLNLGTLATKEQVEALFQKLNSDMALRFYCVEDVAVVINGVSTTYPANSSVEIKFVDGDVFEIIPTSDNSILALNAYPGALGTYHSWLEGVKQFSNILFDMNDVEMYSKWSQGNQGAYQVQYAQYLNCIFWSDNPYISDVSKRTNYTLYYTSQLPLCYSTIPDNTFKSFYLAFNVTSDPNWGNQAYRDSFAKATWATQVFSYYGARTIGIFGHDNPNFNIVLPKDCRGLMFESTAIENAGTFDAENVTNFGANAGSWREAFGYCSSLRNLYIKNLKVSLNISWSPINYDSISFILSSAANTSAITIYLSPYTYNLLNTADFELAESKNITLALVTTNYIEDKRLSDIDNKADKTYIDEKIAELVDSAPETLDTLGELAAAFQENDEIVDILNQAITTKADKAYVDELIANIPIESDALIVDCPDGSVISHTFEQIIAAANDSKAIYISIYGSTIAPLTYVAEDGSFLYFSTIKNQDAEVWMDKFVINSDNSFSIERIDFSSNNTTPETPAPETGETVTTEYTYTYDGDTNSEDHTWITNYGGVKVFAKMGDVPTGNLNLVGATIFRTNPNNQWLDKTFTITQEHLDKVLNKAETDIPAVQEGLIQIYDMMASDFSEFTVLCICTKPGWYNVCFDDWYEIINFPETGIYAYDKRTYGGNDYAATFTFSVTTAVNNSGSGGSSIEGVDTTLPTLYTGNEISMFSRGICIGDSVTEGSFDNADGGAVVPRFSYPAILERITGVKIANAGVAGLTSQTWYEASLDSTPHWGTWVNQQWVWNMDPANSGNDIISKSLDYSGFDFAIIHLGINDLAPLYDNSKTIEEVLGTFETYIGNIITKLKDANTGIKIFLATIVPSYASGINPNYQQLNDKIKAIVEATADTYLMDLTTYSALASKPEYNVTHPTALGYHKLANEIKSYISYIISKNLGDFTNVQFIGL